MNNSLKNWKEPRNTTEIPNIESLVEAEVLANSDRIKILLNLNNPGIVEKYEENLKKAIQETNLWRLSIGLKNLEIPPVIFVNSDEQFNARIWENVQYNTRIRERKIFGKRLEVNAQNLVSDNFRTICFIICHETIHLNDNHYVYSHKYKKRFVGGLDFDQLTYQDSEKPYLEEKIILSEKEIEGIKNYLALVGASLAGNQKTLMELVLQKRQEIGFQPIRDIENKLSPQALKFLNHFITFNPEMSGFQVWQKLNIENIYNYDRVENEKYVYYLTGLLDKANQENCLNEGLCDFLGNLIADKILGKVAIEEEENKEVGYPEYFLPIQNFWNSCDQNQQMEFLNAVLLSKFKYNSIAPIYKFFQKVFENSQNPNFPKRFSIRDIFTLRIFETAENYNLKTKQ